MKTRFDEFVDRRNSDSEKWGKYADKDVIPLWIADTDFKSPQHIIDALQRRVSEGVFGYGMPPKALIDAFIARMNERYQWQIDPEWIVFLPGLVCGLNLVLRAFTDRTQSAILPCPIYSGFINAGKYSDRKQIFAPMKLRDKRWVCDFDAVATDLTGQETLLMLCNPHNPGGTVYRREELLAQLEFAKTHNLVVCSDEIHCDLILDKSLRHIPFASLNQEAAQRSITLMAPSKTFNIAGLGASMAIIPNPQLRQQFIAARQGVVPGVSILAFAAATAAYQENTTWLDEQLDYLRGNHQLVLERINAMPGLSMLPLEATYLAWIDASQLPVADPFDFFLNAGVALSPGADFGQPKFVRLNFGCQRDLLNKALDRMENAINRL